MEKSPSREKMENRISELEKELLNQMEKENLLRESWEQIEISLGQQISQLKRINFELQEKIGEQERAVDIREVLFNIAEAANQTQSLDQLLPIIHEQVGRYMDAKNFYVALVRDPENDLYSFPYYTDEYPDENVSHSEAVVDLKGGFTHHVIKTERPLLANGKTIQIMLKETDGIEQLGTPSKSWMGVPLKTSSGEVIGVVTVQSYTDAEAYSKRDLDLLSIISNTIAGAIRYKQANDALRLEKAYLEQLFDKAPESIVLADLYGKIVQVNSEFTKTFGYRPEEVLGRSVDEILAGPDRLQEATSITRRLIESGERAAVETVRRRKDGSSIDVSILGAPISIDGTQEAIYAIYRDITERKKAEERARHQAAQAELIYEVGQRLSGELELDDLLTQIVTALHGTFHYYGVMLLLMDEESRQLSLKSIAGACFEPLPPDLNIDLGEGMIGKAAASGKPQLGGGNRTPRQNARSEGATQSELAVPIKSGGEVIGVLDLQSNMVNAFDETDVMLMVTLADQVAVAIRNARLYEEVRRELNERKYAEEINRTLFRISNAVNTTFNLDQLYRNIRKSLGRVVDVTNFYIALYDRKNDVISFPYYVDLVDDDFSDIKDVSKSLSLTSEVIKNKQPLLIKREALMDRIEKSNKEPVGTPAAIWLGVPLRVKNEVIGALVVQSYDDPERYTERDVEILVSVSDQVAIAIERKMAEEAIRRSEEQIKELSRQTEAFSLAAAEMITLRNEQEAFARISKAIIEYSDFRRLIISYFKDAPPYRDIIGYGGIDKALIEKIGKVEMPKSKYEGIFEAGRPLGHFSYYLRHTRKDVLDRDATIFGKGPEPDSKNAWHPEDMLFVRMNDQQGSLIGVISVDESKSGKMPNHETVRPLEVFSSLISQIILNKRAQEELEKAKIAAEAAAKSKGEFLANMSHEIRTPMNAIIGFTDLTLKSGLTPRQREYLEKIRGSSYSLLRIINDILDFSKVESGKLDLEHTDFNLQDVMETISDMFSHKAGEKGIELIVSIASDVPCELVGDPFRLRQVLINLTSNALKFTDKGEVVIKANLRGNNTLGAGIRFSVSDTGIGIPREQIPKLFDSFVQADSSTTRKFGGTGLGLSICKRLLLMMDSEIHVKSECGKGSTFYFTIEFVLQGKESRKRYIPPTGLRGKRVLVVDDSIVSQEILLDLLKSYSFEASSVGTGEAALEEIYKAAQANRPYGLLLLDWRMPGIDGIQTTLKIREDALFSHIPIIMMTAFGREDVMRRAKKAGVNAFLMKPVKQSLLFDTIMEVFGVRAGKISLKNETTMETSEAIRRIRGSRVLLVEDNTINQQVATEILKTADITVTCAVNGKEAVKAVKQSPFHAVLMDVQMPEMDGYEATRIIRGNPRYRELPIIAMTAHAMKGDRERCLEAGMSDYVTKPIDTEELFNSLARWITRVDGTWIEDSDDARSKSADKEIQPLPEKLPGLDIRSGLRRMGGNSGLFLNLLWTFCRDFKGAAENIREAISRSDKEKARRLVHTLKGVSGNISALDLHAVCSRLEAAILENPEDEFEKPLDRLDKSLKQVLESARSLDAFSGDEKPLMGEEPGMVGPMDTAEIVASVKKLFGLLEESDLEAQECFEDLKRAITDPRLGNDMRRIESLIGAFDFETAQKDVSAIAAKMGIDLRGATNGYDKQ